MALILLDLVSSEIESRTEVLHNLQIGSVILTLFYRSHVFRTFYFFSRISRVIVFGFDSSENTFTTSSQVQEFVTTPLSVLYVAIPSVETLTRRG